MGKQTDHDLLIRDFEPPIRVISSFTLYEPIVLYYCPGAASGDLFDSGSGYLPGGTGNHPIEKNPLKNEGVWRILNFVKK